MVHCDPDVFSSVECPGEGCYNMQEARNNVLILLCWLHVFVHITLRYNMLETSPVNPHERFLLFSHMGSLGHYPEISPGARQEFLSFSEESSHLLFDHFCRIIAMAKKPCAWYSEPLLPAISSQCDCSICNPSQNHWKCRHHLIILQNKLAITQITEP